MFFFERVQIGFLRNNNYILYGRKKKAEFYSAFFKLKFKNYSVCDFKMFAAPPRIACPILNVGRVSL